MVGVSANESGDFYNKGNNAVWLERTWVSEEKSERELIELVQNLTEMEVMTVMVHAGPLNPDGTINNESYLEVTRFLEKVKELNPEIEYQAWLGQIRSKIDLADENVRHEIAKQALTLTEIVGFDGIHYDIEPVWDEDLDFIELLAQTREILPEGTNISVALAEFIPISLVKMLEGLKHFQNYNSETNFRNVSEYADQIMVMVYDTSIKKPKLYRWLVKEQTARVTRQFDQAEIFIALPAYEENGEAFDPRAENLENGLRGVIDGLNNSRSDVDNFGGIAIYRYDEISSDEWDVYSNLWLGNDEN